MADTTTITQPVITTPVAAPVDQAPVVQTPPPTPEPDLTTKIAQFKQASAKPATTTSTIADTYKDFEDIKDPIAKEVAINRDKQRQADYTRKTQELAQQRKEMELKLAEMQNWTPERIQRELNNPQFVQSAQAYAQMQNPPNSGLTDEQFSALTPQEKAEIGTLKSEINSLKQVNYQAIVAQRDSQLQTRYPDYNPTQIDSVIRELAQMNPLDIREHVYKSIKHDEDVAAAYELGRQEARNLNQTKINAITPSGNFSTTNDDGPIREKGDTDQMWFVKRANWRLEQFKNRK